MKKHHKAASENLLQIMEGKIRLFENNKSVQELFGMVCLGIELERDFKTEVVDGEVIHSKEYTMNGMCSCL